MCNRFPECDHAGPIMSAKDDMPRHCETMLPNSTCAYLHSGCLGCTFDKRDLAYAANIFSIPIALTHIESDAALAIYANAWRVYELFQRLADNGLVSPDWAHKSFGNAVQSIYREAFYRQLTNYLHRRIVAEYGSIAEFEERHPDAI